MIVVTDYLGSNLCIYLHDHMYYLLADITNILLLLVDSFYFLWLCFIVAHPIDHITVY